MSSFDYGYPYYLRTSDGDFWKDRQRVTTLIELYQLHSCLWDKKCAEYKDSEMKQKAKEEIGMHFSLSGTMRYCIAYYICTYNSADFGHKLLYSLPQCTVMWVALNTEYYQKPVALFAEHYQKQLM